MSAEPNGISVVRVETSGVRVAATILAEAFAHDPVLVWAMPGAGSADLTAFFTFLLRRRCAAGGGVFSTSDGSAVAVMTRVQQREGRGVEGETRGVSRATSPAAQFFRWIELHQPKVDHHHLEFIGISPAHNSKGRGSYLLGALLQRAADEGCPVWCYSSNPRNLTFYHRLGFQTLAELRRDAETPAVTSLLWQPPSATEQEGGR